MFAIFTGSQSLRLSYDHSISQRFSVSICVQWRFGWCRGYANHSGWAGCKTCQRSQWRGCVASFHMASGVKAEWVTKTKPWLIYVHSYFLFSSSSSVHGLRFVTFVILHLVKFMKWSNHVILIDFVMFCVQVCLGVLPHARTLGVGFGVQLLGQECACHTNGWECTKGAHALWMLMVAFQALQRACKSNDYKRHLSGRKTLLDAAVFAWPEVTASKPPATLDKPLQDRDAEFENLNSDDFGIEHNMGLFRKTNSCIESASGVSEYVAWKDRTRACVCSCYGKAKQCACTSLCGMVWLVREKVGFGFLPQIFHIIVLSCLIHCEELWRQYIHT